MVYLNNAEARRRQKLYFDKKTKEKKFVPGDRILIHFPNIPPGVNKKFYRFWKGVFTVRTVHRENLTAQLTPTSKPIRININRAKHFVEEATDFDRVKPGQLTTEEAKADEEFS